MKKILALLLITPIMYAKEYIFTCVYLENDNPAESLLINTKEKYITFNNDVKYSDGWEETETFVGAKLVVGGAVRNTIMFNKITGNLQQYNRITLKNGFFSSTTYNFNCVPVKRLMP